jgi:hypothetical protein
MSDPVVVSVSFPFFRRPVTCDTEAKTLSVFFNDAFEGNPQPTYFRLRVFNSVLGIKSVEVKGPVGKGTNGVWTPLKRHWEGLFNWTNRFA